MGHYWLRDPDRSPTPAIASSIKAMQAQVKDFAAAWKKVMNLDRYDLA